MGFVSNLLGGSSGHGFQAIGPSKKQMTSAYDQTQSGIQQQQDFVNALQGQQGLNNQSLVFDQQQALANQLQGVAAGTGPNPAQAMLANSTGANIANQAALMASQRGASANAGMIARQAGQQGAGIQQDAAGQAAALQAQQQLAALGQIQQQQAQMAQLAGTQVGQQQAGLNALGQQQLQNQANVYGLQQNANSANAGVAAETAKSQSNLLGNLMGAAGTAGMLMLGGPPAAAAAKTVMLPAAQQIGSTMLAAEGGQVPQAPQPSHIAQYFAMADGGKVPVLLSPGEKYLPPQAVQQVAQGANPMAIGKTVPGQPKVAGAKDSYANDTVKAKLQPGGVVIPRSVTKSANPDKKAEAFVKAVLAKKGQLPKKA